jgi:hypothetical protein
MYSLKEAAETVGLGKPAILKAIQKGRISANKNDKGQWEIDPAELHRVYPPVSGNGSETASSERQETPKNDNGNSVLRREIELLHERLADKDSVIDDLRRRLDTEAEERRKLTALLTDQRRPQEGRAGRSWWSRLWTTPST